MRRVPRHHVANHVLVVQGKSPHEIFCRVHGARLRSSADLTSPEPDEAQNTRDRENQWHLRLPGIRFGQQVR
jgi:hypothetical protein